MASAVWLRVPTRAVGMKVTAQTEGVDRSPLCVPPGIGPGVDPDVVVRTLPGPVAFLYLLDSFPWERVSGIGFLGQVGYFV